MANPSRFGGGAATSVPLLESEDASARGQSEFKSNWRALTGCMLGASIGTVGLYAYTSGAFVGPLIEAGYTRAQVSLAALLVNVCVAIAAPVAGMLMDRFGALRVIAFGLAGEALGFLLLGLSPINIIIFFAIIIGLAILGVGSTPPGFARIITSRFDQRRGLALGIMIAGPGIVAITAPIWITSIVGWGGWRAGYLSMSAVVVIIGGLGLALIRANNKRPRLARQPLKTRSSSGSWLALSLPVFWIIVAAFVSPALFGSGYLFHMIEILKSRGFSAEGAAGIQSLIGIAIVVGRLGSGYLIDRYPAKNVAAVIFMISALGCALLTSLNPLIIGTAALAIGLTIGAELDILAYIIGRYFGLDSFGRLYGLAYSFMMVGAGASPLLISAVADNGTYDTALLFSAIATFLGALILFFVPPQDYPGPLRNGSGQSSR